jgi:hypothetical protein
MPGLEPLPPTAAPHVLAGKIHLERALLQRWACRETRPEACTAAAALLRHPACRLTADSFPCTAVSVLLDLCCWVVLLEHTA